MVLAGKLFKIELRIDLPEIASRLSGFRREERVREGGYEFDLVTEIAGLEAREGEVDGVYSNDVVTYALHRGERIPVPRTVSAEFRFARYQNRVLLTILEKKRTANNIANRLNKVLFKEGEGILEGRIAPEDLKSFHTRNPEGTKITFFDNIDAPDINKLSLRSKSHQDISLRHL